MQLDSAYELQAEVVRKLFDFQPITDMTSTDLPQPFSSPVSQYVFPGDGRNAAKVKSDLEEIALGIFEHKGEYKLDVQCQTRRAMKTALVDNIGRMSKGEARFRFVDRIRPFRMPWHMQALDVLKMGCSVGHENVTAGTLGAFVRERSTKIPGFVSNNHVLANSNNADPGNFVLQPGPADGGTNRHAVATLRDFVEIRFGGVPNLVDAAWAETLERAPASDKRVVLDSAGQPVGSFVPSVLPPTINLDVVKVGRTTGLTYGEITAFNIMLTLPYGKRVARFDEQISIESVNGLPFSLGGDSGSIIMSRDWRPVALLFAGSKSGGYHNSGLTYANPIVPVLDMLNIVFATE